MGSRGRRDTHHIEHTFDSQELRLIRLGAVTVDPLGRVGKYPLGVCCKRRARRRTQARQEDRDVYGYGPKKKEFQDRLRRIEGQVRGLQRMVDEDQYCIDILTQVNSVTSALKAVAMGLLDEHVRHCVRESIERGEGDEKMEELMSAVARFAGR